MGRRDDHDDGAGPGVSDCQYPVWQASRENPGGDCREPATHAAPLGDTGRYLSLCPQHCAHRVDAIPLDQVPDP
jgi:hypothetical protein